MAVHYRVVLELGLHHHWNSLSLFTNFRTTSKMLGCLSGLTLGVLLPCPLYQMPFASGVRWSGTITGHETISVGGVLSATMTILRSHRFNKCPSTKWPLTNDSKNSNHFSISSMCLLCFIPLVNYHPTLPSYFACGEILGTHLCQEHNTG